MSTEHPIFTDPLLNTLEGVSTPPGVNTADLEPLWQRLTRLGIQVARGGFDAGRLLGRTRHEITALKVAPLEAHQCLIAAGDRSGAWYAGRFDLRSGTPVGRPWRTMPPLPGRGSAPVSTLTVLKWEGTRLFAVGTAEGAWLVPVATLLSPRAESGSGTTEPGGPTSEGPASENHPSENHPSEDHPSEGGTEQTIAEHTLAELSHLGPAETTPAPDGLYRQLPGTEGQPVHQFVYDAESGVLWAGVGERLLGWPLAEALQTVIATTPGGRVTALAIDQADPEEPDAADHLFVATSQGSLHRLARPEPGASFRVDPLEQPDRRPFWQSQASVIAHLLPLSAVRARGPGERRWHRRYPERGVVAATLRHLIVVATDADGLGTARNQMRTVSARSRVLGLASMSLPDWHGLATSTLDGKVKVFRPAWMAADATAPARPPAPGEIAPPDLLNGADDARGFADRVEAMAPLPPFREAPPEEGVSSGHVLPVVIALGDHRIILTRFVPPRTLARWLEVSGRRVARRVPPDRLLSRLTRVALHTRRPRHDVAALLVLLPTLGARCTSDDRWRRLELFIWDILAHAQEVPGLPAEMIQALRALQRAIPDRQAALETIIGQIHRYLLDPQAFSHKRTRVLDLIGATDPALVDDRAVYRAMLISRRHDVLFTRRFGPDARFGEVRVFAPIPWPDGPERRGRWDADPRSARFLVATWRRALWMVDAQGHAQRLKGHKEAWGDVHNIYFRRHDAVLAFADGGLRVVPRKALMAFLAQPEKPVPFKKLYDTPQPRSMLRAVCPLPGLPRAQRSRRGRGPGEGRFLSGDAQGRIHLEGGGRRIPLIDLRAVERRTAGPPPQVTDLRSSFVPIDGGDGRWPFVLAGTTSGTVHLLAWTEGPEPRLEAVDQVRVGLSPVTCLLYPPPESRQAVVATRDGTVVGYQIVPADQAPGTPLVPVPGSPQASSGAWHLSTVAPLPEIPPRPEGFRLVLRWAWKAGDIVRCLQYFRPDPRRSAEDPFDALILVGSHSGHLHVLDLAGRPIETCELRGLKVDRFIVARPAPEDGDRVDARVYVCAFENEIRGVRIVSRTRLLADLQADLDASPDDHARELRLTRWRAFALEEGHLRHRFIRQSRRYPRASTSQSEARQVIDEINRRLRHPDHGPGSTGLISALLRRLFQRRPPGTAPTPQELPRGLAHLVEAPPIYGDTLKLLRNLETQWNTPGSGENQRVQLHWIRSMLRNVESIEALTRWREVGERLADGGRAAPPRPVDLLSHFLAHPRLLLQYKAAQYLERLFFGWPGVQTPGLIHQAPGLPAEDLEVLIEVLLQRLALGTEGVSLEEPHPVLLLCGRMLCLLIQEARLDALRLVHLMRQMGVPSEMHTVLAAQSVALSAALGAALDAPLESARPEPGPERRARRRAGAQRLRQAATLFDAAHQLEQRLAQPPFEEKMGVVISLQQLIQHCDQALSQPGSPDRPFLTAARAAYARLVPILQVRNLEDLVDLPLELLTTSAAEAGQGLSARTRLEILVPVLEALGRYRNQKWGDFIDPPMQRLRYPDFREALDAWRTARAELVQVEEHDAVEVLLLGRLLDRWGRIIDEEQQTELLRDFMSIVETHCLAAPLELPANSVEAMGLLAQEGQLNRSAFTNLFVRLVLFAEPDRAAFLHRAEETRHMATLHFETGASGTDDGGMEDIGHLKDAVPRWLPAIWARPVEFSALDEHSILFTLSERCPEYEWEVRAVAGGPDDPGSFGYYLFGWHRAEAGVQPDGLLRFRGHRLARDLLIEALVLRQATLEHRALRGRLFSIVAHNLGAPLYHIRSDLRVLLDGFLEDAPERRQAKYQQMLQQARHMDGILDGILSLSDRRVQVSRDEVDLAELVYEVVRTLRPMGRTRRIEIGFARPDGSTRNRSTVWTDTDKVYDILVNVVGNAVKYSPPGGRVKVALELARPGVSVVVADQGPGIPEEERVLIFEPFYRGSRAMAEGKPGLGLGLYVARVYAQALEARLQVAEAPSGGAIFTLFLPRMRPDMPGNGEETMPV